MLSKAWHVIGANFLNVVAINLFFWVLFLLAAIQGGAPRVPLYIFKTVQNTQSNLLIISNIKI